MEVEWNLWIKTDTKTAPAELALQLQQHSSGGNNNNRKNVTKTNVNLLFNNLFYYR